MEHPGCAAVLNLPRSTLIEPKVTQSKGRAYLYTKLAVAIVSIETLTKVPRSKQPILAANIGLEHVALRVMRMPYLVVQDIFTDASAVIHDCVVHVKGRRFLISAHYRATAPINGGLKELAPGFDWRGELNVVALGRRVPYLVKMDPLLARIAVNK